MWKIPLSGLEKFADFDRWYHCKKPWVYFLDSWENWYKWSMYGTGDRPLLVEALMSGKWCAALSVLCQLWLMCVSHLLLCLNSELRRQAHAPELQGFCAVVLCQLRREEKVMLVITWHSYCLVEAEHPFCIRTLVLATEKSCQRFRVAIFPFVGMKNDYSVGGCSLVRVLMDRVRRFSGTESTVSSDPLFLFLDVLFLNTLKYKNICFFSS